MPPPPRRVFELREFLGTVPGLSRVAAARGLVDGILGQGTRAVLLITTNSEVESIHPALTRPGRAHPASILIGHNHPSGDPSPNQEDREVTACLVRAGELLGVPVLDHVVVAEHGYVSLREAGDLTLKPGGPSGR